ncbi:MAG: hypothetical protein PHS14_19205 [Elusimicrobia bacterium]|nr:hypothetical protein [Elusimicrobiota bacterium]
MKPLTRKTNDIADLKPARSRTRAPDVPLDLGAEVSFSEVEPAAFRSDPNWSIMAAVSDPDVEDTIGGE